MVVFIKTFTLEVANVYRNSDPGVHYGMALNVLKTGETTTMYFAPVYNALVMAIFQPFLAEINLYKAFILADSFANLLNLVVFWVLGISFCKSRFMKIILPVIGIFYFSGWPFLIIL